MFAAETAGEGRRRRRPFGWRATALASIGSAAALGLAVGQDASFGHADGIVGLLGVVSMLIAAWLRWRARGADAAGPRDTIIGDPVRLAGTPQADAADVIPSVESSILQASPAALLSFGPDGIIGFANPACCRLLGVGRTQLEGCAVADLLLPTARGWLAGLISGKGEFGRTVVVFAGDGSSRTVDVSVREIGTDPQPCWVAELRDAGQRLSLKSGWESEREAAGRRLRQGNDLLRGLGEELRAPLQGMLGHAQSLRLETVLSEADRGRLDGMVRAGRRALELVDRALDLAAVDGLRLEARTLPVEIGRLAGQCRDLISARAASKRLGLELSLSASLPERVSTDPVLLRRIMVHLMANAVRFTETGVVRLHVEPAQAAGSVGIEVIDTGPGIDPAVAERLLRGDPEPRDRARLEAGAGFGLMLCQRLAGLLGGRLEHRSNPAGGSIFRLELPAPSVGADDTARPAPDIGRIGVEGERQAGARADGGRLSILVVDDRALESKWTGTLLRGGHRLFHASQASEALGIAERERIDLVLLAWQSGEIDGPAVARGIRALDRDAGSVPILALTAADDAVTLERCLAAEVDGCVATSPGAGCSEDLSGWVARLAAGAEGPQRFEPRVPMLDHATYATLVARLGTERTRAAVSALCRQIRRVIRLVLDQSVAIDGGNGATISGALDGLGVAAGEIGLLRLAREMRQAGSAVASGETLADRTRARLVACATASITVLQPVPGRDARVGPADPGATVADRPAKPVTADRDTSG